MTADSAVSVDFPDHREYETGRKVYRYPGIGCVTTWGSRDGNRIGPFLDQQRLVPTTHTVVELAKVVYAYLVGEFKPGERQADDVGYHVGGFDGSGRPRLFHVFWGVDRPNMTAGPRKYEMYDHSPSSGIQLLYNGRNDLADLVAQKLIKEIREGAELRLNLGLPNDQVRFGDFVARFAAELTPEVGPPFLTLVIGPSNEIGFVKNDNLAPIAAAEVKAALEAVGCDHGDEAE